MFKYQTLSKFKYLLISCVNIVVGLLCYCITTTYMEYIALHFNEKICTKMYRKKKLSS